MLRGDVRMARNIRKGLSGQLPLLDPLPAQDAGIRDTGVVSAFRRTSVVCASLAVLLRALTEAIANADKPVRRARIPERSEV